MSDANESEILSNIQNARERISAELSKVIKERAAGVMGFDGKWAGEEHGSGI